MVGGGGGALGVVVVVMVGGGEGRSGDGFLDGRNGRDEDADSGCPLSRNARAIGRSEDVGVGPPRGPEKRAPDLGHLLPRQREGPRAGHGGRDRHLPVLDSEARVACKCARARERVGSGGSKAGGRSRCAAPIPWSVAVLLVAANPTSRAPPQGREGGVSWPRGLVSCEGVRSSALSARPLGKVRARCTLTFFV